MGVPGAWLYAGDQAVLHVVCDRPLPASRAGVIDHIAFSASALAEVKQVFDARALPYSLKRQAGAGTWQLFFHDSNGARVALDFDVAEMP